MLISQREAVEVLAAAGLGPRQARRLLALGLAGEPVRTRAALLHDRHAVEAVAASPRPGTAELDELRPFGWLVVRREVRSRDPWDRRRAAMQDSWDGMSVWTSLELDRAIRAGGPLPVVAALNGFVLAGADLIGFQRPGRLLLREPGEWFEQVRGSRVPSPAGRPWHVSPGPVSPEEAHGATIPAAV